jgi:hypothetical protein
MQQPHAGKADNTAKADLSLDELAKRNSAKHQGIAGAKKNIVEGSLDDWSASDADGSGRNMQVFWRQPAD